MSINNESYERHIKAIDEGLTSLEYYCDTEIVGDDARHMLDDIKAAQREHLRTIGYDLKTVGDLKPLYDRLKRISSSIKVMRNTLSQCENAINESIESCDHLADAILERHPLKDDDEM